MRFGREISGAFYGTLSWLLPLVMSLAVTPRVIAGLGLEAYGLYLIVMGFVGYSFNLNVSRAVTKYIAQYRGSHEEDRIPGIISAGILMAFGLGVLAVSTIALGADWYVNVVVGLKNGRLEAAQGLVIGGLIICALLVNQVFLAVIQGFEAFRLFSWLSGLIAAGTLFSSLLVVNAGFGFVHVLWAALGISCAGVAVSAIMARRLLSGPFLAIPNRDVFSKMIGYSKYVIGYQLIGNLVLLFERTSISRNLGPDQLTYYVVPMMICLQFHGFVNALSLFLFPMVAVQRAEGAETARLYHAARKIVITLAVFAVAATALHGENFLRLWIGPDFARASYHIFVVLMVGFSCLSIFVISFHTAEGFGFPKLNFLFTLVSSCVTVALMVAPFLSDELERYALARTFGFSTAIPAMLVIERLTVGTSNMRGFLRGLPALVLSVAVFSLVSFLTNPLSDYRWLGFTVSVMLGTGSAILTLWALKYFDDVWQYFKRAER